MIQYIEKLKTECQGATFPSRYFGVLHYRKIGIEIGRSAEPVPALCKGDQRATAGIGRRRQVAYIEVGFASCLHKERIGIRHHTAVRLDEELRRETWVQIQFDRCLFAARRSFRERPNGNGINPPQ